ncbi:T9SS type A sorting domain-containing protein [Candidatus Marifrigoribacter sp. Uisw_064]|uniref:T9SS type A sorting domain-containing protein n=1 Tax=Candidatus Marifrigoribacter sp. Uisw_064 TaxID=3230970 RepID=UPI003D5444B9
MNSNSKKQNYFDISIYSINGLNISSFSYITLSNYQIDISHLTAGVYIINFIDIDGFSLSKKLIVE